MRTAQQGDRVRVHFVKHTQTGAVASSHAKAPLEMTVGAEQRCLPGLGLALVVLGAGIDRRLNSLGRPRHGADPRRKLLHRGENGRRVRFVDRPSSSESGEGPVDFGVRLWVRSCTSATWATG
jgi:hypothetical protein